MSPRGLHLRKNETTLGTIYLTGVTRKLTVAQALKRANMGCSLPYKYLMAVVSSSDLSFLHLQTKKVRKKKKRQFVLKTLNLQSSTKQAQSRLSHATFCPRFLIFWNNRNFGMNPSFSSNFSQKSNFGDRTSTIIVCYKTPFLDIFLQKKFFLFVIWSKMVHRSLISAKMTHKQFQD